MLSRSEEKLAIFTGFAEALASLSTCKRLQVGCVVVPKDFSKVHSIGYNGPPAGVDNDSCNGAQGGCGCVHAEANALIKLTDVSDALLITTRSPCPHCAGLIVNSRKISSVLWLHAYRNPEGLHTLAQAGISVLHYEGPHDPF